MFNDPDTDILTDYDQKGNKREDDNITQVSEIKVTDEPLNKVEELEILDL